MEQIKYIIKERTEKIVFPKNLGFGQIFTDHIFEMDYTKDKGWHNPTIKPLENLQMHPAMSVIHYGQSIFEGLKAFKTINDEVVIFRPDVHIQRLNNSAKRICMPEVDVNFALEALKELVAIESDWIPVNRGEALYIRPFMFGTDPALGVRPSFDYKLVFLLSPVGAYYPEGFKPVKILIQDDYVRAVRKGLGECKTSANYAASLLAAQEANKKGLNFGLVNVIETEKIFIRTDREKLETILSKLVKNAIKYTKTGIIESGYEHKGKYLLFFVRDTGIGIEPDKQLTIFDRFTQADNSLSKSYEGAGLGLSISKAYVEMLRGTIWVDSEPGKGSVFYFTLPNEMGFK